MGLTVAAAAAVQGAVGFGMNLLAVPVLLLLAPGLLPGPLLVGTAVLVGATAWRERAHVDPTVGWALLGRLPGTALALVVLTRLTQDQLTLPLALMVLVGVALTASRLRVGPTRGPLIVAGSVSGFMGTVSTIGGPPMALVYARSAGPMLRGTLAAFFLAGTVVSLVALTATGLLAADGWLLGLTLVPPVLLGQRLSRPLARHLDAGRTRPAVLAVSAVAGVLALVAALG